MHLQWQPPHPQQITLQAPSQKEDSHPSRPDDAHRYSPVVAPSRNPGTTFLQRIICSLGTKADQQPRQQHYMATPLVDTPSNRRSPLITPRVSPSNTPCPSPSNPFGDPSKDYSKIGTSSTHIPQDLAAVRLVNHPRATPTVKIKQVPRPKRDEANELSHLHKVAQRLGGASGQGKHIINPRKLQDLLGHAGRHDS